MPEVPLRDISPADKRRDAQAGRRGAHQSKINEDQRDPSARGGHQTISPPKLLHGHQDNLHEIRVPFGGEPDKHGEVAGDDRHFKDHRLHKRARKVGFPQSLFGWPGGAAAAGERGPAEGAPHLAELHEREKQGIQGRDGADRTDQDVGRRKRKGTAQIDPNGAGHPEA